MMEGIAEASPRLRARMAGAFYVFSVLSAIFFEMFLRGKMGYAANFIQMSGMVAVTLLSYYIFKAVNRSLSLLAASFNLVGLMFEALRVNSQGVNLAVVFHGIFCMLIGFLIYRSTFLPRILGALIAFGGLSWLTYLSPPLSNYLSPHNLACGLLGEASVFLWLLVMGVNVQLWQEQAGAGGRPSAHECRRLYQIRTSGCCPNHGRRKARSRGQCGFDQSSRGFRQSI